MDQEEGLRVDDDVKLIVDYLKDYRQYIDKRLANPDEIEGITTGIKELDTITGGFKEGEFSVLAARTSIGKTSIALHMALEAAKLLNDHEYVCFFSLEMSANQLINRIISIKVNETVNTIIKKNNMELLYQGLSELAFLNLLVDSSGSMDLNVLRKKIASIDKQYSIKGSVASINCSTRRL
ncbi:hypothetical protein HGO53_00060 [Wolbachia endosymbiont of Diaphorina citri]|uniref:DnaB-like helicase C-terminal domain-containing protein n=1 Tax=Wolbachia endosymbiont of Diaphorina citri TaxID=116598 RepID=UPI00155ED064|nr:DnaB-like helicase C-terminal domain-containing protein [Wolbachia endosymbiont of Diaphorina citri]QJT93922.1 hypothetical protein HGO48_00060 [Wolbachia endosymbiont of Diaphorina citri]QJT95162.1 hypothetical protein HGO49_00060 [Wolbachia endosymbiont of Diaphorina citri]QJT96409.1 hypothetical protein HGO53_00060 [Wolbachia endosymbiont of Diaphorina citri]QLK10819.1 hypothetical protein FK497_00060 [Wolbachia endosymbiont of Diaphorina citri]